MAFTRPGIGVKVQILEDVPTLKQVGRQLGERIFGEVKLEKKKVTQNERSGKIVLGELYRQRG